MIVVCCLTVAGMNAAEIVTVGKIVKTKGNVIKVHRGWERKTVRGARNITLFDHDSITTGEGSKAYIKLIDGSKVFLDKKSNIMIRSNWEIKQKYGDVQYDITKRPEKIKLQVITDFAKINVTGTKFRVITTKEGQKVVLKEGNLNFELPRTMILDASDERCTERYVKEVGMVDIKGGEALTFADDGKIYKECGVSRIPIMMKKELPDAVTLLYRPYKGMHQCGAISNTFTNAKTQPSIVGVEDGCVLSVMADYHSCRVVTGENMMDVPYTKEGMHFSYTLKPIDKTKEAKVQYQCVK